MTFHLSQIKAETNRRKPMKLFMVLSKREDSAVVFEFSEEAFDKMPLLIQVLIVLSSFAAVTSWWNDRVSALGLYLVK